ncbi:MAG: DMT family transporter, partial [Rhodoglobus sp.]
FPLIAGIAAGYQQAANGQLRHVSHSPLAATFMSFLTGTLVLVVAAGVSIAVVGWKVTFPTEWWLYSGGLVGIVFIAAAIVVVRTIGVLLLSLATIAGQLLGALALDVVFPISGGGLPFTTIIGTIVTLLAVSLAAVSAQRSKGPIVGLHDEE